MHYRRKSTLSPPFDYPRVVRVHAATHEVSEVLFDVQAWKENALKFSLLNARGPADLEVSCSADGYRATAR